MKQVTIYAYDPELRPRTFGADFEDGNPNHSFTLRFEREEALSLMNNLWDWRLKEYQ